MIETRRNDNQHSTESPQKAPSQASRMRAKAFCGEFLSVGEVLNNSHRFLSLINAPISLRVEPSGL